MSAILVKSKHSPAILAVLFVMLFFVIFVPLLPPFYETNDDVGMSMIVAGQGFASGPDEHILFSHIFIGLLLKFLYSTNNHFPWYGSYLLLCHFVALASISFIQFTRHGLVRGLAITAIIVLSLEVQILSNLQFTTTSFVLAGAGALVAATWVETAKSYKSALFIGSILLLVASSMVRYQMFCFALILIGTAFIPALIWTKNRQRFLIRASALIGTASLISYGLVCINNFYYTSDPGWQSFYDDCALNGVIRDYARPITTDEAKAALQGVGWTQNDVLAQRSFLNWDQGIFSTEKTKYVVSHLPAYRSDLNIPSVLQTLIAALKDPSIWSFGPAVVIFLTLRKRDIPFVYFATLLLAAMSAALLFVVFLKLPTRIFVCITGFLLLTLSFTVQSPSLNFKVSNGKRLFWPSAAMLCTFLSVPYFSLSASIPRTLALKKFNKELKQTIKKLNPQSNQLYIVWGCAFPYEAIKPLDDLSSLFEHFNLLSLSCQNGTPIMKAQLERFSLTDPFKALVTKNSQIFLISSPAHQFEILSNYFLEHYGINVRYQRLFNEQHFRISVYKVNQTSGRTL